MLTPDGVLTHLTLMKATNVELHQKTQIDFDDCPIAQLPRRPAASQL